MAKSANQPNTDIFYMYIFKKLLVSNALANLTK